MPGRGFCALSQLIRLWRPNAKLRAGCRTSVRPVDDGPFASTQGRRRTIDDGLQLADGARLVRLACYTLCNVVVAHFAGVTMRFTLATQTLGSLEMAILRLYWQRGLIAIRAMYRAICPQRSSASVAMITTANPPAEQSTPKQRSDTSRYHAPFSYVPAVSRARSWQWR